MHPRVITNALGAVIAAGGAAMLVPAAFSLPAGDGNAPVFAVPALASAFGSVFACLNITGTSLGPVGEPEFNSPLPTTAKMTLTFYMLLGRLELFTVLVLLTLAFWRG